MDITQPGAAPGAQEFAGIVNEMTQLSERLNKVLAEAAMTQASGQGDPIFPDPNVIGKAFQDWWSSALSRPDRLAELHSQIMAEMTNLGEAMVEAAKEGKTMPEVVAPPPGDRRFSDDQWSENPFFSYLKQTYLLSSRWATEAARTLGDVEPQTRMMVDFYTRQMIDAFSPTNFLATNPEALRATVESGGKTLLDSYRNLVEDLERGGGKPKIRMTDVDAFEVGKNIAVTPGKVVFQNDMFQLLQYTPTTEKVYKRPLLIVPPWINKFYVLDLSAKKSFIKWAVDQGLTVFVVSWVNPDASMAKTSFDDYMIKGILEALTAVEKATGERLVNLIGYCIGGTLTSATLAYMAAKGDDRVASATLFTTMTDFEDAGEIKVFVDESQLESLEDQLDRDGYLDGSLMSTAFNLLRANDLIWSYVVRYYLLGKDPVPFDILYWNSDSTRLPAMMHKFYLRQMYIANKLREPGGITLAGEPIDLRKVETPIYMLSAKEDHIAPWKSTYAATQLFSGPVKFVLGGSGHIAGVINPATSTKYGYWTNTKNPKDPEDWFKDATQNDGSWWNDWIKWIGRKGGGKVDARQPGDGDLAVLEDAPGSYVKASRPGD
ncbi:MAG: PHA/PHB synthase family protein [Magnetospiraceae bacterium]